MKYSNPPKLSHLIGFMPPILALIFCGNTAMANSNLPPCEGSESALWDNCFGTLIFSSNNDKYVGEIKMGKADGMGTYTFVNGDRYSGQHKNGKFHGSGNTISAGGVVRPVTYENGELKTTKTSCQNYASTKYTYATRYEESKEKIMVWVDGAEFSKTETALSIKNAELVTKYRNNLVQIKLEFLGLKKSYEYEANTELRIEEKKYEARPLGALLANTILLGIPLITGPTKQFDNAFGCKEVVSQYLIPIIKGRELTGKTKWNEYFPREVSLKISGLTKDPFERNFSFEKNEVLINLRDFIDLKKRTDKLSIEII
jgi:hypothetical protein